MYLLYKNRSFLFKTTRKEIKKLLFPLFRNKNFLLSHRQNMFPLIMGGYYCYLQHIYIKVLIQIYIKDRYRLDCSIHMSFFFLFSIKENRKAVFYFAI